MKIGVHTLTRESQEVMPMFISKSSILLSDGDGDEDVRTLIVVPEIPISGQLNITTSSLPDKLT